MVTCFRLQLQCNASLACVLYMCAFVCLYVCLINTEYVTVITSKGDDNQIKPISLAHLIHNAIQAEIYKEETKDRERAVFFSN